MKTDSDDTFVKQINKALPTSPQTDKQGNLPEVFKGKKKKTQFSLIVLCLQWGKKIIA